MFIVFACRLLQLEGEQCELRAVSGLCGLPVTHLRGGQSRFAGAACEARCGTLVGGASWEAAGASWETVGRTRGALPEAASCSGALAGGSLPAPRPVCSLTQLLPCSEASTKLLMIKACSQDPNEAVAVIAFEK